MAMKKKSGKVVANKAPKGSHSNAIASNKMGITKAIPVSWDHSRDGKPGVSGRRR